MSSCCLEETGFLRSLARLRKVCVARDNPLTAHLPRGPAGAPPAHLLYRWRLRSDIVGDLAAAEPGDLVDADLSVHAGVPEESLSRLATACRGLEMLSLRGATSLAGARLLDACGARLTSLSLVGCEFAPGGSLLAAGSPNSLGRLSRLSVQRCRAAPGGALGHEEVLGIVRRCVGLRDLDVAETGLELTEGALALPPLLEKLNTSWCPVTDAAAFCRRLVAACPRLREFVWEGANPALTDDDATCLSGLDGLTRLVLSFAGDRRPKRMTYRAWSVLRAKGRSLRLFAHVTQTAKGRRESSCELMRG